jgi:hypothetical protein
VLLCVVRVSERRAKPNTSGCHGNVAPPEFSLFCPRLFCFYTTTQPAKSWELETIYIHMYTHMSLLLDLSIFLCLLCWTLYGDGLVCLGLTFRPSAMLLVCFLYR